MDKLVEHGIRMLEIVDGENDFFRNDAKRQADIARAVYDTILRVQVLECKSDRNTENCSEKPNNCETCKHNKLEWYSEVCDGCCGAHSNYEPKTEPQTCANGCKWQEQDGECTEPSGECHIEYRTEVDEPQTLTAEEKAELLDAIGGGEFFPKDEPQTDCAWMKGEE